MSGPYSGAGFRTLLPLLAVLPVLTGCCTGISTDPRSSGLAGGVCGLTTGAYGERLRARQNEAAALQVTDAQLNAKLKMSQEEAESLEQRIAASRRHMEARRAEFNRLSAALDRLIAKKARSAAELARIEAERDEAGKELASLMERTRQAELVSRAARDETITADDHRSLAEAETLNSVESEDLDWRLLALRRALAETPASQTGDGNT